MNTFTNYNEIKTLLVSVSEEIDKNNIEEFVYTSLNRNNTTYSKNDIIYISFLSSSQQYQILISKKTFKFQLIEIFSLFYKKKEHLNTYDLYLNKNFLVIYKNAAFYYFQEFDHKIASDDLLEYFQKKLHIKLDNIKRVDCSKIEELKEEYILSFSKSVIDNINTKKEWSFLIYLSCISLFIFIIISYYFLTINNINNTSALKTIELNKSLLTQKKLLMYKFFDKDLNLIIENLRLNKLKLKKLNYQKNSIHLVFSSKVKDNIYTFLDLYSSRLISSDILFDEKRKNYECNAHVKLFRK